MSGGRNGVPRPAGAGGFRPGVGFRARIRRACTAGGRGSEGTVGALLAPSPGRGGWDFDRRLRPSAESDFGRRALPGLGKAGAPAERRFGTPGPGLPLPGSDWRWAPGEQGTALATSGLGGDWTKNHSAGGDFKNGCRGGALSQPGRQGGFRPRANATPTSPRYTSPVVSSVSEESRWGTDR